VSTGDLLAEHLLAKGYPQDEVDIVVERAALLQFLAGKTRWKAGVDAQIDHLGKLECKQHDI
jgi:hypothetical protein